MSMLRHRKRQASTLPAALLYSSRSFEDIIYSAELEALAADPALKLTITLTRSAPTGWLGQTKRIGKAMIQEATMPQIFICGSNSIVESVSGQLIELGHAPALIKTERFGPSAGEA